MKNIILIIMISLLLVINGVLLYVLQFKKDINPIIAERISNTEKTYINKFIGEKENENLKLNKQLKLVTIKGDTIFAKDAFKTNSLVLRYSILNCGNCVDAEFKNLEQYAKQFSKQINIITYHERIHGLIMDYKKLQKQGLDNITVYMLLDNKLGVPLEEHNIPYYFHLTQELTLSNVFIPLKEQPKLSKYYLKYSFKNFFNKETNTD